MRNGGIQIRIGDLIYALHKRKWLIVGSVLFGILFSLALSGLGYLQGTISRNYEIRASFSVTTQNADGTFSQGNEVANKDDLAMSEDMVDSVIYVLKSDRVLDSVINELNLVGITADDISRNLSLTEYNSTPIIEVVLEWRSAEEGTQIVNRILSDAVAVLPETLQMGNISVINAPEAEYLVGGQMNFTTMAVIIILCFFVGVAIVVLELVMHPTLINLQDVEEEFGLETLGVIPKDDAYFKGDTSMLVPSGSEVEQNYAAAAYILRNRLGTKEKQHIIYVTSADRREGRTTAAAGLAIQIADMEHRVLLVDFDTRNPTLSALLRQKLDYSHSLNALYKGEATPAEAVTTLTGYLDFLPMIPEHPQIPLDGTVFDLIRGLSGSYEYVIMDASPVGVASEALSLNQLADAVVFVIGFDSSGIQDIQSAIRRLDKSGIRVVGAIVNRMQELRPQKRGGRREDAPQEGGTGAVRSTPFEAGKTGEEAIKEEIPGKGAGTAEDKHAEEDGGDESSDAAAAGKDQKDQKEDAEKAKRPPVRPNLAGMLNAIHEYPEEEEDDALVNDEDAVSELLRLGLERSAGEEPDAGQEQPAEGEEPEKTPDKEHPEEEEKEPAAGEPLSGTPAPEEKKTALGPEEDRKGDADGQEPDEPS